MQFNKTQTTAMDQDCRQMLAAGIPLSGELQRIENLISSSPVSAQSSGPEIDAICLANGACTINFDLTVATGLTFAWLDSRARFGLTVVAIAAGSLTLSPSNTNFIEVGSDGTVYSNTAAFTPGRIQLYKVVTGVSGIVSITNAKVLLTGQQTGGVTGAMLSTAGATKEAGLYLGTPSTSGASVATLIMPGVAGTITAARIAGGGASTVGTDDGNFWTFSVSNRTAAKLVVDGTAAANSTKATGGSSIVPYLSRALTLGTGANIAVAAGDVLEITVTPTGTPGAISELAVRVDVQFAT